MCRGLQFSSDESIVKHNLALFQQLQLLVHCVTGVYVLMGQCGALLTSVLTLLALVGAAVDATTRSGRATPLHRAAHIGNLEIINTL